MLCKLGKNFSKMIFWNIFLIFLQIIGFAVSCTETIHMKHESLFSGKNKKNISKYHLLNLVQKVVKVKTRQINDIK